jgi:hypothetical protein
MMRGHTIIEEVTLVTESCVECGVLFAITADMQRELRKSHAMFYCPSGHQQHYTAKSDEEKLRDARAEIERLNRRVANRDEDLRAERASHVTTRGHLTRAKKQIARAEHGVCPHCRRHFDNVERHMHTKHPEVFEK